MYVCAYSSVQLDKSRVEKEFTLVVLILQLERLLNRNTTLILLLTLTLPNPYLVAVPCSSLVLQV